MHPAAWIGVAIVLLAVAAVGLLIRRRNAHLWLPGYIADRSRRRRRAAARARAGTVDVMFAFVDHFEPVVKPGQDPARKAGAVAAWTRDWPPLAARHRDSDGRPPRMTWTFPLETYDPGIVDALVELSRQDLGEVEVHLHHDGDSSETFRAKMLDGLAKFARHGVATVDGVEGYRFAFVHGDWALDNARPDGRYCGVNDELTILRELGCFADLTYPSAPSETQPRKSNAIYYATDDPARPKSHDGGIDVEVGRAASGDLMLIQGPLRPDGSSRKLGIIPRIDNAAITGVNPGTPGRINGWIELGTGVVGRPEWVFIKVHCHSANVDDRDAVLGAAADAMFTHLERTCRTGRRRLHYVTAREMYNIIKAAEQGRTGDPTEFRDLVIPPYKCTSLPPSGHIVSK